MVAFLCTLALVETGSRFFLSSPESVVRTEHENLIRVLGLPGMVDILEPDPDLFWRLKAGVREKKITGTVGSFPVSFTVNTDDRGFRSGPVPAEKNEYRVLALGNSCTFGVGVDDDETWPAQLEHILSRAHGGRVRVINGSVPGYTAFQGKRFLEKRGFDLEPDLVIACFGFNDAATWSSRSDRETARVMAAGRWEEPLQRSRAYTGLKRVVGSYRIEPEPVDTGGRPRLSRDDFRRTLLEIREICTERNVPVLFLLWPYRVQREKGIESHISYQDVIAAAGESGHVPVVSLVQPFLESDDHLFVDNVHANAAGCRVVAETIAGAMAKARVRGLE